MRDFWPGGNTAKISFESVKWRVSHQFVDVNNMIPADKMPESESKAKHNDSRRNSHASARMSYMKQKYIQRIPLKQIRSGSPGRGFANQRFALRLGSTTLACSQVYRLALRLGSTTLAWAQYDSGQILKIIDRDEVLLNQSLSFQMNEIFFFRERTIDKRHQISFFIKFHLMRHF